MQNLDGSEFAIKAEDTLVWYTSKVKRYAQFCAQRHIQKESFILVTLLREGIKKNRLFLGKSPNYGWVGVKSPKLVKM